MGLPTPNQVEYHEDLFEELENRDKDLLARFFNHNAEEKGYRLLDGDALTQEKLRKYVAGLMEEEIREFLDQYEQLAKSGVRTDPAIDYLSEHYDIQNEELDVDTRYQLLLLLYEEDLTDQLDELIVRSRIRSYSATRGYMLDEGLTFNDLEAGVEEFHRLWNREQETRTRFLLM
jgi:hypothetical protein